MKKARITIFIAVIAAFINFGFECKSPEMTTANLKYNDGLYAEAIPLYKKELQKRPQNGDAWLLLGVCQMSVNPPLLDEAANSALEAEKYIKEQSSIGNLIKLKKDISLKAYNKAINELNTYSKDTSKKEYINSAIRNFELAMSLRKDMPVYFHHYGYALEKNHETDKAVEAYVDYYRHIEDDVNFAAEKGIYIGLPIAELFNIIGQPTINMAYSLGSGDSALCLIYQNINGMPAVFYLSDSKKDLNFQLKGWDLNPPRDWSREDLYIFRALSIEPLGALASIYIDKEDYLKAIEYIIPITQIDPNNPQASNALVLCYQKMNKKDEALSQLERLVAKNPKNANYLLQYANLLANLNEYDKAIAQYKKVLEIDKDKAEAMRNLAACYNNKVADIQEKQEALFTTKNIPKNPEEYLGMLNEASINYEKSLQQKMYQESLPDQISILTSLADIYNATDNKEYELMTAVSKLQKVEKNPKFNDLTSEQKMKYYYALLKIYDRPGREYENKEFFSRFKDLKEEVKKKLNALN